MPLHYRFRVRARVRARVTVTVRATIFTVCPYIVMLIVLRSHTRTPHTRSNKFLKIIIIKLPMFE